MCGWTVLEHDDGVWEIVYGPSYTDRQLSAPLPPAITEENVDGLRAFAAGLGPLQHLGLRGWSQPLLRAAVPQQRRPRRRAPDLDHTADVRDADDQRTGRAIAEALAPYEPIPMSAAVVKMYMTKPPTREPASDPPSRAEQAATGSSTFPQINAGSLMEPHRIDLRPRPAGRYLPGMGSPITFERLLSGARDFAHLAMGAHAEGQTEVFLLETAFSVERLAKAALVRVHPTRCRR